MPQHMLPPPPVRPGHRPPYHLLLLVGWCLISSEALSWVILISA